MHKADRKREVMGWKHLPGGLGAMQERDPASTAACVARQKKGCMHI